MLYDYSRQKCILLRLRLFVCLFVENYCYSIFVFISNVFGEMYMVFVYDAMLLVSGA